MTKSFSTGVAVGSMAAMLLTLSSTAFAYRASDLLEMRQRSRGSGAVLGTSDSGTAVSSSSSSVQSSVSSSVSGVPLTQDECLRAAISKRENTILYTFNGYYSYIATALKARSTALNQVMDQAPETRRDAMGSVWKGFGFTWREAGTTLRELRRNAWAQYRLDRLACGVTTDKEAGGYGMDSQF